MNNSSFERWMETYINPSIVYKDNDYLYISCEAGSQQSGFSFVAKDSISIEKENVGSVKELFGHYKKSFSSSSSLFSKKKIKSATSAASPASPTTASKNTVENKNLLMIFSRPPPTPFENIKRLQEHTPHTFHVLEVLADIDLQEQISVKQQQREQSFSFSTTASTTNKRKRSEETKKVWVDLIRPWVISSSSSFSFSFSSLFSIILCDNVGIPFVSSFSFSNDPSFLSNDEKKNEKKGIEEETPLSSPKNNNTNHFTASFVDFVMEAPTSTTTKNQHQVQHQHQHQKGVENDNKSGLRTKKSFPTLTVDEKGQSFLVSEGIGGTMVDFTPPSAPFFGSKPNMTGSDPLPFQKTSAKIYTKDNDNNNDNLNQEFGPMMVSALFQIFYTVSCAARIGIDLENVSLEDIHVTDFTFLDHNNNNNSSFSSSSSFCFEPQKMNPRGPGPGHSGSLFPFFYYRFDPSLCGPSPFAKQLDQNNNQNKMSTDGKINTNHGDQGDEDDKNNKNVYSQMETDTRKVQHDTGIWKVPCRYFVTFSDRCFGARPFVVLPAQQEKKHGQNGETKQQETKASAPPSAAYTAERAMGRIICLIAHLFLQKEKSLKADILCMEDTIYNLYGELATGAYAKLSRQKHKKQKTEHQQRQVAHALNQNSQPPFHELGPTAEAIMAMSTLPAYRKDRILGTIQVFEEAKMRAAQKVVTIENLRTKLLFGVADKLLLAACARQCNSFLRIPYNVVFLPTDHHQDLDSESNKAQITAKSSLHQRGQEFVEAQRYLEKTGVKGADQFWIWSCEDILFHPFFQPFIVDLRPVCASLFGPETLFTKDHHDRVKKEFWDCASFCPAFSFFSSSSSSSSSLSSSLSLSDQDIPQQQQQSTQKRPKKPSFIPFRDQSYLLPFSL